MKKLLAMLLVFTMVLGMAPAFAEEAETYELALVTDVGTIDDKSFNQGAWEGLMQYAEENGISYKYYQPPQQSDEDYLATIKLAVDGGAKIIVTPGYLFEVAVYEAQSLYPDVHFILLDGEPHDADYNYETKENTAPILYAEQQAGYLAGYAAVKDGFTKLGFMGGMQVPAVIRFGYGFVKGADDAAVEMGLEAGSVSINYHYTGGFAATPEAQATAAAWYNDGVEVIFGCGGAVDNSVMAAAEAASAYVIGVDVDQSGESETVITSAMKGLGDSVYQTIAAYYAGEFPGGVTTVKDASNNGVQLPMETSKFMNFTQEDYDAVYAKLASNENGICDTIPTNPTEDNGQPATAADIATSVVAVTIIE